ncbi:DUF2487 domain-containing protein [Bacillus canaveralius]|uniref:DUF2487 domain-containing protein n=1 Tax=Bacillus canaveralius TaxID=1403243 RepID=A0A2N5GI06_9BACI|nr:MULTISPECIES: YpiF family protein [Bacillus]PLR80475.1 DUF2487 domain-containing protein [Bacillus canaveralius]PLR82660.1 DUF2487 domain-containing protein [Bacillus sp. V33-4]PLS00660.1 DUF2487 domain-containing protein [Bacillus canaveralius]RSK51967.1 DUF2487 family protein [Bacillus canaveralius]
MKWSPQDIDMYLNAKEYVDTAVLPLLPVSFDEDMKQAAAMTEFITLLAVQIERQFKGRLILLPGFAYLKSSEESRLLANIKEWERELKAKGFPHIIYVTSDSAWKSRENEMEGSLIWLPTLPLEHMDESNKITIIEDQVKQLLQLFIQKWRENS